MAQGIGASVMIFVLTMRKTLLILLLLTNANIAFCQSGIVVVVVNERGLPVNGATVKVLREGRVAKTAVAGEDGKAVLERIDKGLYKLLVSGAGYHPFSGDMRDTVRLVSSGALQEVTVNAQTPPIERKRDRTIVNVEASATNTGLTALEVLERSPGVTVDRNGGVALNGKPGVLVIIDDKPTYLSGEDLNLLLSSMNSAQVSRIELIPQPSAAYDAAGNAGIINIKTKKIRNDGLNGTVTASYGQGVYPKSNNNLVLNYRRDKVNAYLNYSFSAVQYLTDIIADRKYQDAAGNVRGNILTPSFFKGDVINHTGKAGIDYAFSPSTTVGLAVSGLYIHRNAHNVSHADWMKTDGTIDSSIVTTSRPENMFRNGSFNVSGKQVLSPHAEISADVDYLHYEMTASQDFDNRLLGAGGYDEVFRSRIPTTINIFSSKVDAVIGKGWRAGGKLSSSETRNAANYQNWESQQWVDDDGRSNRFAYREHIQAGYVSFEGKMGRASYQAGLRYEHTGYTARESSNHQGSDSVVKRDYSSFFPSGNLSYVVDSSHTLTLSVGRRIDRPVFQSLNPFLYIINKYTYQTGNPYLLPQYSWNFELSHQYKAWLTSSVSYSRISDYFSQLFLSDTSGNILYYTQGNVGMTSTLGATVTVSLSPVKWWSVDWTTTLSHRRLKGFNGNSFASEISSVNLNISNTLRFAGGYTGELSGFYTSRSRQDIQEMLYPAGQVSLGVSKAVLKKKGTLKASYRDIFYTSAMEGLTSFPHATEYFKIKRDSRVLTLSLSYRFGRSFKVIRRNDGATEEKERVGNGG